MFAPRFAVARSVNAARSLPVLSAAIRERTQLLQQQAASPSAVAVHSANNNPFAQPSSQALPLSALSPLSALPPRAALEEMYWLLMLLGYVMADAGTWALVCVCCPSVRVCVCVSLSGKLFLDL